MVKKGGEAVETLETLAREIKVPAGEILGEGWCAPAFPRCCLLPDVAMTLEQCLPVSLWFKLRGAWKQVVIT
jgi:hypothetical protein